MDFVIGKKYMLTGSGVNLWGDTARLITAGALIVGRSYEVIQQYSRVNPNDSVVIMHNGGWVGVGKDCFSEGRKKVVPRNLP